MQFLSEHSIFIFLIQILILLSCAKFLGALSRRFGYPELVGEIFTGIILGPTLLGRISPNIYNLIFPAESIQQDMLGTVSWLGVLFLLLSTGFEVNVSAVWKQGWDALKVGLTGIIIPVFLGIGIFFWLPDIYLGSKATHWTFVLFLSAAASISAVPVIAKVLYELEILKTDLGLSILSEFIVNDILGWLFFSIIISLAVQTSVDINNILKMIFEIVLFGTVCLTLGSKFVGLIVKRLKDSYLPYPGVVLTFIFSLSLISAAITQWIGIHPIFGFFLSGIMVGNTPEISEHTKQTISQFVYAIFIPLFFATIGIRIDFFSNIDLKLLLIFSFVAIGGKFLGAFIGAKLIHASPGDTLSIGISHIPGGAMEIVVGLLALELNLITDVVFVAIVTAAIISSIAVGPLFTWTIRRRKKELNITDIFSSDNCFIDVKANNKWDIIMHLSSLIANKINVKEPELLSAVYKREKIMGTGVEKGIAIPHASIKGLKQAVLVFARSAIDIEWDTVDGSPVRYIFLLITPLREKGLQTEILSSIAKLVMNKDIMSFLSSEKNTKAIYNRLIDVLRLPDSNIRRKGSLL